MKKDWNKAIFVLTITFIVSVISILHVIVGYFKTPAGMIYMWTGHYYLDYFQYVQAFAQGMQGKWLLDNPLTLENTPKTFIGMWQNLIFGKIGQLFHLSPISAYWWTVFSLSMIFGLLMFKLIENLLKKEPFAKQVAAYILALFAAPFYQLVRMNKRVDLQYFAFWSDKSVLWKRFESIPYHLTANILSVIVLLWLVHTMEKFKTLSVKFLLIRVVGLSGLIIFLLTFSPATALLLIVTIGLFNLFVFIKYLIQKQKDLAWKIFIFTGMFTVLVVPASFLIRSSILDSYYKIAFDFEKNWQIHLNLRQFFLTFGPLALLAFFGLKKYLEKLTYIKSLFLLFISVSFILFFSPLALYLNTTNTRFLTPLSYVLFGVLSVLWIKERKNLILITIVLLLFFLPVNIKAFQDIINDKNIFSPITYLPKDMIGGFKFLANRAEKGNVLLTPSQFLGCVLPIYVDRKVYVARHNITLNYLEKNITASNFYLGVMSKDQALDFLEKNDLKFVVLSSIEGYDVKPLFRYPFLQEIYRNKDIIIFEVKN